MVSMLQRWWIIGLSILVASCQYNAQLGAIFGQLTVASYCPERSVDAWNCTACKKYPHLTQVKRFRNATNDTVGFIGVDNNLDAVVLVFRGTMPFDIKNWIVDIDFLKRKYPLCDNGCEVHEGFYKDYLQIHQDVANSLANYSSLYKKKNLFVTGHSLGGALATHAVAHLIKLGYKVDAFYTLGSPRVADALFEKWFSVIFQNKFKARIVHHKDPVPHLPFMDWGFRHLTTEIFYNERNTNYKVCSSSGEDPTCSNQFWLDLDIEDHLSYFGINYIWEMTQCQI